MIDDDLDDQYFYKDLFTKFAPDIEFDCVSGQEELNVKYQNCDLDKNTIPDLILLDLNLPKTSGKEIFIEMHKNERLKFVPVVVLTTSSSPIDMNDCKSLGIDSYFVKPLEYDDCKKLVRTIYSYWFECNAMNKLV